MFEPTALKSDGAGDALRMSLKLWVRLRTFWQNSTVLAYIPPDVFEFTETYLQERCRLIMIISIISNNIVVHNITIILIIL